MNIELNHDGTKCTLFKINDKDFGQGITELNIKIVGGEKPLVMIQGTLDSLNALIEHCNIMMRDDDRKRFKPIKEVK